jgi:hypothetical protein
MEPIESSKTSANNTQMPGTYPKESKLHLKHGENLKSRIQVRIIDPTCKLFGKTESTVDCG